MDGAEVRYRPARHEDAEATFEVVKAAVADLAVKAGRAPAPGAGLPPERVLRFRRSQCAHDPDGFWVAEAGGEIVGAAIGVRRDDAWYLAALHVLPGWQGRGIGSELLRRAQANAPGAAVRTVLTDASNPDSNGLYLRAGLLPVDSTLTFDGPIGGRAPDVPPLWPAPLDPATHSAELAALDRATVGFARPVDHAFWAGVPGLERRLLVTGSVRGYVYASHGGAIGPVAVHDPADLPAALEVGAQLSRRAGATALHVRAFGSTHGAIAWAGTRGLRLTGIGLFLATAPRGRFAGYVTSGTDALY